MGSLPLGNGRLGAMVYGGTQRETIALSELTLWSGQPDPDCNNMLGPDRLREIRARLNANGINYLLNVGPDNLGRIPAAASEILHQMAAGAQSAD